MFGKKMITAAATGIAALVGIALAASSTQAAIVLYSTDFSGAGGLNGVAVDTSGATLAQHAQYGTNDGETWTAHSAFNADGTYTDNGSNNFRQSATLSFTPQDGYVYTLTMTTNYAYSAANEGWHATGFFATDNYTGQPTVNGGPSVWALTRPGRDAALSENNDQTTFLDANGGTDGSVSGVFDDSAPSTLAIVLDTTLGAGDWSAEYFVGGNSVRTESDLNSTAIQSVGIAALYNGADTAAFQSFELSVNEIPEPASLAMGLVGLTLIAARRRRSA